MDPTEVSHEGVRDRLDSGALILSAKPTGEPMSVALALIALLISAPAFAVSQGDPVGPLTLPDSETSTEGRVVLLNFWASWCGPCKGELPLFNKLHADLNPSEALVVTVNIDRQQGPARGLIRHLNLTLPVIFDADGELAGTFQPPAMPTSYLIGPSGRVEKVYTGSVDAAGLAGMRRDMVALLHGQPE